MKLLKLLQWLFPGASSKILKRRDMPCRIQETGVSRAKIKEVTGKRNKKNWRDALSAPFLLPGKLFIMIKTASAIFVKTGIKNKRDRLASKRKQLIEIFKEAKAKNLDYDCIVPYSGGKDSTFTLWAIVIKYGLKPLVVSFDHGFYRPRTLENRTRTFRRLGVDVITFTPNWQVVKKLMLEALIRKGDFCWHCHAGVFAYPMQIAVKFKIPLLIWGEGGGEYEAYFKFEDLEETDEWKFNRRTILGMRAEDLAGFSGSLKELLLFIRRKKTWSGWKSIPLGNSCLGM